MRCQKRIPLRGVDGPSFHPGRPCTRNAVRDGFCRVHHPEFEAAKKRRKEYLAAARLRARQRDRLVRSIGDLILRALEVTGVVHIRDYSRIRPKTVINLFNQNFVA